MGSSQAGVAGTPLSGLQDEGVLSLKCWLLTAPLPVVSRSHCLPLHLQPFAEQLSVINFTGNDLVFASVTMISLIVF